MADQRALSVAVLNVLRVVAGSSPVLIAIDDVMWLSLAPRRGVPNGGSRDRGRPRSEPRGRTRSPSDGSVRSGRSVWTGF
jgi:hypothetical protein